jgi:hypothetical protein
MARYNSLTLRCRSGVTARLHLVTSFSMPRLYSLYSVIGHYTRVNTLWPVDSEEQCFLGWVYKYADG